MKGAKPVLRWTLDLRTVNSHTKLLQVPLPQIESNILCLQGSKFFTGLDLANAYFHLKVAEDSKKFLYLNGPSSYISMEYMPFGAATASQHFTLWVRQMYEKLPGHLQRNILFYLDDLLVHTITVEQHLQVLK